MTAVKGVIVFINKLQNLFIYNNLKKLYCLLKVLGWKAKDEEVAEGEAGADR